MDERDKILNKLPRPTGDKKPSAYISMDKNAGIDLVTEFIGNLSACGGRGIQVKKENVEVTINEIYGNPDRVMNLSGFSSFPSRNTEISVQVKIDQIDLLIVDGLIGVAGNGAVWLTEDKIGERKFPFIATDILILLQQDLLVPDLFQAYPRIDLSTGFGLWIAGPSKTADIEQSLVIGAQGALRHTVFIFG
ncbi:MAG: LUD domain-containing protein [Cyclobacteriaceae bacterium]|nr:LUD domain-containing protein [Cyclobacteriaceae bacterium]